MSFSFLSNELILLIANHLEPSDLSNLLQCSQRLLSLCTRDFYRESIRTDRGIRILTYAAKKGDASLATVLIEQYQVDPNVILATAKNTFWFGERTALDVAAFNGHIEMMRALLKHGANMMAESDSSGKSPLHYAVLNDQFEAIRLLIDLGADVMAKDFRDATPLHFAAIHGNPDVCRYLLSKGAAVDAASRHLDDDGDTGITPLHYAAEVGNVDSAKVFLDHGADINARTELRGRTPLATAAYRHCASAVAFLLANGADVSLGPEEPLKLVFELDFEAGLNEIVMLFLDHGADVDRALTRLNADSTAKLKAAVEEWHSNKAQETESQIFDVWTKR